MAADRGYKSYLIAGEQDTDWDTLESTPANMIQTIYELVSITLRNVSTPIVPSRMTRYASPIGQVENMINAAGDISLHMHANDMLVWFKHLFCDDSISSTDVTAQTVYADQTWINGDNSLDTQPTATDPTSDPGQLIFTFSAAQSVTVTITGTDQNDVAITDTLVFDTDTTKTTDKYFKTVDANGINIPTDPGVDTLKIEADKNVYNHTIELKDDLLNGLTIETIKGSLPNTYVGCLLSSGTLDIGDIVSATFSIVAKKGNLREGIEGTADTPTDVSGFSAVEQEIFPGWGIAVTIDGSQIPVATTSFSMNNQLDYPTRLNNTRYQQKPVRQDFRDIALTSTIDYNSTYEFDVEFESGQACPVILRGYCKPYAGPEYSFAMIAPTCELTAYPDPEVTDFPEVIQELALRPARSTDVFLGYFDAVSNTLAQGDEVSWTTGTGEILYINYYGDGTSGTVLIKRLTGTDDPVDDDVITEVGNSSTVTLNGDPVNYENELLLEIQSTESGI